MTNTLQIFLRRRQVEAITGLPTASLYEEISKGRFPKPISLSKRRVAWLEDDVAAWQQQRISEARGEAA